MSQTLSESTLTERYAEKFANSYSLYGRGVSLFPNGVTHDARFLQPFPIYVERAEGSHKWDVDGHRLIDWWSGHGSLILGHSHPEVVEAVQAQMSRATHPGACHELEVQWGELVRQLKPSIEKMRFVNSGTEATMMALRLARTFTGKHKVLKFRGHFHGWNDFLIQDADPPYEVQVPGLGADVLSNLEIIPPNDLDILEDTLRQNENIGCVILEPTGGHYGHVPIRDEFLQGLREITARHDILLIFDEVITGFRVHPGGAQGHYHIKPDLTTMAKILAGGLPGGCLGGREDVLQLLEIGQPTDRKMPHPGTFNANPLSASAGIATLNIVQGGEPNRQANKTCLLMRQQLNELFEAESLPWIAYGDFSAFHVLTNYNGPPPTGDDFLPYNGDFQRLDPPPDKKLVHAFRIAMLLHNVDLPALRGMVSASHTKEDVARTIEAVRDSIRLLREDGFIA
jgi:glutamate-1-semialdehyde 2,1-aminomutase